MGCIHCGEHGCDDCMDITIAWKYNHPEPHKPHVKMKRKKGIVTPNYIRRN